MKVDKVEKLVTDLHDKIEYFFHIRNSKQVLNQRLVLKKVQRVITKSLAKAIDWLKKMNKLIRIKLMNNAVFRKIMENVRKHRNIKLVMTESRKHYLVSEPNYQTTKFFAENVLAIEMIKTHLLMNKPAYLGLSILNL